MDYKILAKNTILFSSFWTHQARIYLANSEEFFIKFPQTFFVVRGVKNSSPLEPWRLFYSRLPVSGISSLSILDPDNHLEVRLTPWVTLTGMSLRACKLLNTLPDMWLTNSHPVTTLKTRLESFLKRTFPNNSKLNYAVFSKFNQKLW